MMAFSWSGLVLSVVLWNVTSCVTGADLESLKADRRAVEQVYHDHRLGTKPPFEEAFPEEALDRLVRLDLHKETLLKRHYRVVITPAEVEAEVSRIRRTTRVPEMLAEIEATLDHDPERFARAVARPLVVDRRLRGFFANDDLFHANQRRRAEAIRKQLIEIPSKDSSEDAIPSWIAQYPSASTRVITWQLTKRLVAPTHPESGAADRQSISIPPPEILPSESSIKNPEDFYFEDLPAELRRVLKVQLTQPGSVSAVIDLPLGFMVYRAHAISATTLSVLSVGIPKGRYEQWLAEIDSGAGKSSGE